MVGFAYKNIRETHKTTFCCYLSRRLAVGQRGGGAENSAPGRSIGKCGFSSVRATKDICYRSGRSSPRLIAHARLGDV